MLCLLALARGLALSAPGDAALLSGPPALIANSTTSVAHLAGSVAAASLGVLSDEDKQKAAAALRATSVAYAAQAQQQQEQVHERVLEAKANATKAAIAKDDLVAKEVERGQFQSSQQALDALRASEARSPVGTLLGDRARSLEQNIVVAEEEAAKELDALDKVRELTDKKNAEVVQAEHALAEVRKQKAATEKEAEMAEQIALEKRQDVDTIGKEEQDAAKKLDDLRNEAEAVQEMVERKKQLSDATERRLADQAAAAEQAAATAPLLKDAPAPEAPSANVTDYALVKQENAKLRAEKDALKQQLDALNAKKPSPEEASLEAENQKLAEEKAALQHEIAAKLAAAPPAPAAAPAEASQSLRKKLVVKGFGA